MSNHRSNQVPTKPVYSIVLSDEHENASSSPETVDKTVNFSSSSGVSEDKCSSYTKKPVARKPAVNPSANDGYNDAARVTEASFTRELGKGFMVNLRDPGSQKETSIKNGKLVRTSVSKGPGWISTKTRKEKDNARKNQIVLSKKSSRSKYNMLFKVGNHVSCRSIGDLPMRKKGTPKNHRRTRSSVDGVITKKCTIFENQWYVVFENGKKGYFSANVLKFISATAPNQVLSKNINNKLVLKPSSLKLMKDNDGDGIARSRLNERKSKIMEVLCAVKLGKEAKDLTYNEIVQPFLVDYSKWLSAASLRNYVYECKLEQSKLKLVMNENDNHSNENTSNDKELTSNEVDFNLRDTNECDLGKDEWSTESYTSEKSFDYTDLLNNPPVKEKDYVEISTKIPTPKEKVYQVVQNKQKAKSPSSVYPTDSEKGAIITSSKTSPVKKSSSVKHHLL